jgi:two-component system CheB/CheR fusion protein
VQLIDDLLDVSRIVTGKLKMELEPVRLGFVVKAAVDAVAASAQKKSITIKVFLDESVGPVSGDRARLEQVVSNLLTNAIKFTPNDGEVTVLLETVGGKACLRVSDTGVGIEPGFLPRIFNRFTQEDSSTTRTHGGLGLGLAIVHHLVEAHGGTVRAESPGTGQGATFHVTLPLMALASRSAVEPGGPPMNASSDGGGGSDSERLTDLRVLVVDDDASTRDAIAEMLAQTGAKVRMAASAAEGMTVFQEFQPDVLLCDIAMPVEDGYTFIRRIRALGAAGGADTPAVALTALAGDEDRRQALAAGFHLHMAKPVDIDRLAEAVARLAASADLVPPAERSRDCPRTN